MKEETGIKQLIYILLIILPTFSLAAPKDEFRGAWVTAWSNGYLSPEEADETVRLAKEANLNALFIQVRKVGDAYYNSSYEPRASNITGPAEYDPLAYIIEKAHSEGIQVHAWMNTFRIWTTRELPTDPNHIVNRYPGWLTRTADGNTKAGEGLYLDPGVQEVQDYTFNVFMDVVKNYDIDGIHFDYVRYPNSDFGYAPAAVERFNREIGRTGTPSNEDPKWKQWRRDQVTAHVRRVYKAVNDTKPGVLVSAATIPWGDCSADFCDTTPFVKVYQDWRAWMEEGILDVNIPMNYKNESNAKNAQQYRNWLDGFKRWRYDRQVYTGLDFNQSSGNVLRQIEAARKRGITGMVGFSFNQTEDRLKLVQVLKYGAYSELASAPELSWKKKAVYRLSRERYVDAMDTASIGQDLDKAIELMKDAVKLDPKFTNAYFHLGKFYARKEMYEDAIKQFEKVLAIDADYGAAKEEIEAVKIIKAQETGNREQEPISDAETEVL